MFAWLQASENGAVGLPSGDLVYKAPSGMQKFATSLRLIRALPWRRFKKGSVLVIEVSCQPMLLSKDCHSCLPRHWRCLLFLSMLKAPWKGHPNSTT